MTSVLGRVVFFFCSRRGGFDIFIARDVAVFLLGFEIFHLSYLQTFVLLAFFLAGLVFTYCLAPEHES